MSYISHIFLLPRASGQLTGSSSSARLSLVRLADKLLEQVAGWVMPGGLQVTSPLRAAGFVTGFTRSVLLLAHMQCCLCVCLSLLRLRVDVEGTNKIISFFICNFCHSDSLYGNNVSYFLKGGIFFPWVCIKITYST